MGNIEYIIWLFVYVNKLWGKLLLYDEYMNKFILRIIYYIMNVCIYMCIININLCEKY